MRVCYTFHTIKIEHSHGRARCLSQILETQVLMGFHLLLIMAFLVVRDLY